MTRIKKDFIRKSGLRDARLFVVATEGQRTEPKYFSDLTSPAYYYNPRVHVEVIDRIASASSPQHIINELDIFKSNYKLKSDDELWMVIDLDNWPSRNLSNIATKCIQKKYHLAISNPCFETWLLLHIKDIHEYPVDRINKLTCKDLITELKNVLGEYNKNKINTSHFLPYLSTAIAQAKQLDINPNDRWPQSFGTRIYLLVSKIINNPQ